MTELGYFLSCEEHDGRALVEQAKAVERAGIRKVTISDHFHPWLDDQGHSPFVWSVIGGIAATTSLEVTTAVTAPILRIHPAILAQATATCAQMLEGRFRFGVGTGERLNEHVLGQHWPPLSVRQEMLVEAIEVMRELWGGEMVTRRGTHYVVENAQIFTRPDGPIPVLVSAFGPDSAKTAAEIGDGFVSTSPDADSLQTYRGAGGKGPAIATIKVCWGPDEEACKRRAHEKWRSSGVPGESAQELSVPRHFDEAAELVTPDAMAEKIVCGNDPERFLDRIREYIDAGFDEVHLSQVGEDVEAFLEFVGDELLPKV
jgi:G6PDH family F420-dependent oxidoreductase